MAKKDTAEVPEPKVRHAVFYTDGGCRPSRGYGGYGVHGYVHAMDVPKQGAGARSKLTVKGYVEKSDAVNMVPTNIDWAALDPSKPDDAEVLATFLSRHLQLDSINQEVQPLHYVDVWASIEGITTNNTAELLGAIEALEMADKLGVRSVLLFLDSNYVREGITKWVDGWTKNGWKKSNGEEVNNRAQWERLLHMRDQLTASGVDVKFQWVRGHNGDLGNTTADILATRGRTMALKGVVERLERISEPKGYWSRTVDVNRMLSKSYWYFNSRIDEAALTTPCGRRVYHLGKHGDDDSMLGKPTSEVSYSVVFLKEPEPVLEKIRQHISAACGGVAERVIMARLDAIQQPKHYLDIAEHGCLHLEETDGRADLMSPEKVALVKEATPSLRAFSAINYLSSLEMLLALYVAQQSDQETVTDRYVITDITDQFYVRETDAKGKVTVKLLKEIDSSKRSLKPAVNYDTGTHKGSCEVALLLDMDLPSRNTLAALAARDPIVRVITWAESETAFRYATIVEADGEIGIWSSFHSNMRPLTNLQPTKK